ncbi:unnamed protein product [Dovyalis caffra]|uniref:C-JID domain-containing protein n=1 Tax=Dovyalis caffra TaxID=77055 RepID=A0AAV1R493_9ROSI|nr:unnamed protein product [Dovyalis caffra]
MERLSYLYFEHTRITKLPSPIGNLMGLTCLEVGNCLSLKDIKCFVDLQLPERDVDLKFLCQLTLRGCQISEVPDSLGCLRNCMRLESLPELLPRLVKLDPHYCSVLSRVSSSSTVVEGNIFEFIFTDCQSLHWTSLRVILAYSSLKFQLYIKRLYNQVSDVPAKTCSFCFFGSATPMWFSQQSWGFVVTTQLPSHSANSEFLGFTLCAIIRFTRIKLSLQVKCTYHFRNKHGGCHDFFCYLHGCYDEKHLDDNLLPLSCCKILECGVLLLYANDETRPFDFIMPRLQHLGVSFYHLFPDQESLESWFKAKRPRDDWNYSDCLESWPKAKRSREDKHGSE